MKLIVIGGGPAGYVGALRAAKIGYEVTLIEKEKLGGTCLNRGCVPTKSLLQAAAMYDTVVNSAKQWGIEASGADVDFEQMYSRKNAIVEQLQKGIAMLLDKAGVKTIFGTGKVLSEGVVKVEESGEEFAADRILICTGSQSARLPIPGIELALSSDDVLAAPVEGKNVAIIGGGVIGVEFAVMLRKLGCEVSIYEFQNALVAMMDSDISKQMALQLKKMGVKLYLQAAVSKISKDEEALTLEANVKEKPHSAQYDTVIACTGRKPFRGGVLPDGMAQSENIKFAGDAAGGIQLAHFASAEATVIVERWAGVAPSVNLDIVPQCIYTSPEVAAVGKRERDCGDDAEVSLYRINGNGKSLIMGENSGFVKIISDKNSGRLLGAHIVAPHATDMISELAVALSKGMTKAEVGSVIHPHPTVSESIFEACNC